MHNRKQRNVLIIVQNLPVPFDRRVWQEATSLRLAGFGVAVICPKKKIYKSSHECLEGVDIYRYPLLLEANNGIAGYFVEFVYCWLASLWLAIKAYVHRPFHAIHACNPPDTFFALALLFRPLGVKFVFDHHDLCPEMYVAKGRPRSGVLYQGLLLLERLTLRSAHLVIAVNESHREIALRRGGIDPEKVVIVRSGPSQAWADIEAADDSLRAGRRHLVMYLGEMCEQDGVDHLLRAIQHYATTYERDTLFAFIGGGPDQPRMKALASEMGLDDWVCFTGRVSDVVLWQYLATADLGADPDPWTEWSNLSTMNKIVEYMAFGRPIVAFDLAENRRSAQDAAAYVVPNDDTKMSEAIRELLIDPDRRDRMSTYGRQRFREILAWEHSEQQLIGAYSDLLNNQASERPISPVDVANA
ncbi:MAG: glycosyltransferase family 4 protein [Acidobacteriaceae bacterium]